MESIIFVVHRIPFPPDKGDKIRSFQILKSLSKKYRVSLVCFVDDKEDMVYERELYRYADDVYVEFISRWHFYLRIIRALLSGVSITESVYQSKRMSKKIRDLISLNSIRHGIAYSSAVGKYLVPDGMSLSSIIDFVDVDSNKWYEYSKFKGVFFGFPYRRESRLLATLECELNDKYSYSTFVTESERIQFETMDSGHKDKNIVNGNGVSTNYFNPDIEFIDPYKEMGIYDVLPLCFVGAMDYFANENAVTWFMDNVLPGVLSNNPSALFIVVGRNPSNKLLIKALNTPGVVITGAVNDVRPYIHYSQLVVAPLQIARGIQNKVLEAMAMNKRVVGSLPAIEGIDIDNISRCLVPCSTAGEMIKAICEALDKKNDFTCDSRNQIVKNYSWKPNMDALIGLIK